jgi:hypothetical protein
VLLWMALLCSLLLSSTYVAAASSGLGLLPGSWRWAAAAGSMGEAFKGKAVGQARWSPLPFRYGPAFIEHFWEIPLCPTAHRCTITKCSTLYQPAGTVGIALSVCCRKPGVSAGAPLMRDSHEGGLRWWQRARAGQRVWDDGRSF